MSKYPTLFSPIKLKSATIKNKIIMAPMGTDYADSHGVVTPRMIEYYTERARGGVGLIIVEVVSVDYPMGAGGSHQVKLTDAGDICGWQDLTNAVHAYGTTVIAQLHHAGLQTSAESQGAMLVAPSDGKNFKGEPYRALTIEEIHDLEQKFIKSAVLAKLAGLDGIELHSGHGYLISQFLSWIINKRTDEYGGSAENRARFLTNIIKGIRSACGNDFIISVRYGMIDTVPGGRDIDDGIAIGKLIDEAGVDLIDITTGLFGNAFSNAVETQNAPEGNRLYLAKALKPHVRTPISIVGKLRSPAMMEEILQTKVADMVTVGRPFICDPHWPLKVECGREGEVRQCISCSEGCFGKVLFNASPVECALNPYAGREVSMLEGDPMLAATSKNIVVVGGGLAGMQAAVTAAKRGHKVTLLEKTGNLGGQLNLAIVPPDKKDLETVVPWFTQELKRLNVKVKTNVEADADSIQAMQPDAVIICMGSVPMRPPIPGIEKTVDSWDVLQGVQKIPEGKKVVVIGGGTVACETALAIADKAQSITILEMLNRLARGQEVCHNIELMQRLRACHIQTNVLACVSEIRDGSVVYTDKKGNTVEVACDIVILSTGQKSIGSDLSTELKARGILCYLAGDSKGVGNIRSAVRSGFDVAHHI